MNLIRTLSTCALLLSLALLSGCGFRSDSGSMRSLRSDSAVDLSDTPQVKTALYQQYRQWKGTPYKYGGMDRSGVDCSAFVYITYRSKFGLELPRSTDEQINVGIDVTGRALRPGDLLFFNTGFFDRHVGIYLENKYFLHASKEKGIIISSLDNEYWRSKFKKAKRLSQD
jgi:cell wall-associated NlpC family hydrolase